MKPSPPPPPPSPPRKTTSGFGPRTVNREVASDHQLRDELEASTANGHAHGNSAEPSTLNRGPQTVAREQVQASPRGGRVDAVSFDDETQARRVDTGLLDKMRRDALVAGLASAQAAAQAPADLGVDYESLPSLEVRRPYDSYEAAFEEHDPVTQLGRAGQGYESAQVARAGRVQEASYRDEASYKEPSYKEPSYRAEPSYQEPSYKEPSYESSYEDSRGAPGSYYPGAAPSFPLSALDGRSEAQNDQEHWARREESGPRERPSPPSPSYNDVNDSAQWSRDQGAQSPTGWSSMPPVNKTAQGIGPSEQALIDHERERIEAAMMSPQIPPAPRVPNEMRPAFVVGVQPLRSPTPDAWGSPRVQTPLPSPQQAIHSSMPAHAPQHAGYPANQQYVQAQQQHYAQQQQQQYAPPPQGQYAPHAPPHYSSNAPPHPQMLPRQHVQTPSPSAMQDRQDRMGRSQPVGQQLTQAPAASPKIGRFAWFVAGAAFGITFAFFATGFFSGGSKASDFPAPAPLPTVTAPAANAPAAAATALPTTLPATTATTATTAATTPAVAAVAPPVAVAPAVAPVAQSSVAPPAAAPAQPKVTPRRAPAAPRRPVAPASQAPKNLGGGGAGADDERPAPAAPSGGGSDIGDLLGAGLKP